MVLCVLGCTRAALMHSMVLCVPTDSLSGVGGVSLYVSLWKLTHCSAYLWLLLWTQNPRVHSSMVRAADCRSAGPWFNSGWKSWFSFVTGSDNLTNQTAQRNNIMSPIRTVITTITRKSVKNDPFFFFKKKRKIKKMENDKREMKNMKAGPLSNGPILTSPLSTDSQKSHFHKGKSSSLREEHVFPVLASARTT